MAYCSTSDVETLMQATFSSSSRPAKAQVVEIIDNIAAEIDGVCQAAGYVIPVTGAQAVAMLKTYNAYGAAVACWHAGFVSDVLPPRVEYWYGAYRDFLSRLKNGLQQLPGASITSEEDIDFAIAPTVSRDGYWTTGERVDQ